MLAVNAADTETGAVSTPDVPVRVYYNNDFETNADGITIIDNQFNRSEYDADGGYLYLRASQYNDAVATWNKGADGKAELELPEQFIVSFNFAAIEAYPTLELRLVDEDGDYIKVLSGGKWGSDNVVKYHYSNTQGQNFPGVSTAENIQYLTVKLAFDMTTGKYTYYYDSTVCKPDLVLPGSGLYGTGSHFGTVQYIEITSRGDDTTDSTIPGNLIIDNFNVSVDHTYTL